MPLLVSIALMACCNSGVSADIYAYPTNKDNVFMYTDHYFRL